MSAIAMEVCPVCASCPRLSGRWRLQVRCSCGACGPRMKNENQAILRWNLVVQFMRELAHAGAAAFDFMHWGEGPAATRELARSIARRHGLTRDQAS